MNLTNIWMTLFGTTTWLGLDMGFWVSMAAVALIVVIQNIVFWKISHRNDNDSKILKKSGW